ESLKAHPAIVTACYVDTKGILKYLEPQKYKDSEGADISKQAHTMAMLENPSPIMSTAFSAVEGVAVIVLAQPLYDAKNIFVGSLALTIDTSVLPQLVLDENKLSKDFELWAMETDGMMVLNQDKEEIGLNLFTDELYQPHESLRVLGKKIAAETKGDGEYRFMATGTDQVVDKKATWDTISMHGRDWRVVLIQVKK
ncbi:MAG TPA: cache domain-containing protein, partial [Candidatus Cloacimonadota bacterium]|nr:cache domain-containing protein [Candidatus Cloacimonadota bacterium]